MKWINCGLVESDMKQLSFMNDSNWIFSFNIQTYIENQRSLLPIILSFLIDEITHLLSSKHSYHTNANNPIYPSSFSLNIITNPTAVLRYPSKNFPPEYLIPHHHRPNRRHIRMLIKESLELRAFLRLLYRSLMCSPWRIFTLIQENQLHLWKHQKLYRSSSLRVFCYPRCP